MVKDSLSQVMVIDAGNHRDEYRQPPVHVRLRVRP